jgi:hypothetical protein
MLPVAAKKSPKHHCKPQTNFTHPANFFVGRVLYAFTGTRFFPTPKRLNPQNYLD